MSDLPKAGQIAPAFDLPAAVGGRLSLAELAGRHVVLFFFPKASTPGWTLEARGFRDATEQIREAGAEVVGISADKPKAQRRFAERLGLSFPMLCDEEGTVIAAYGVRGLLGFARRVSFLIDADGVVRRVYPKVSPSRHAHEVLDDLRKISSEPRAF